MSTAPRSASTLTILRFCVVTRSLPIWPGMCMPLSTLPGVERWPAADKRLLARVIRAKGGPAEMDYVRLFDTRKRL